MEMLHHYCGTEAFLAIVSNRSIRLSSLTLSNDSQEGELIREILLRLARESKMGGLALHGLELALKYTWDVFDGRGFCLSEDGDLLSQWRGYADDGYGLAIGFNAKYLEALGDARRQRGERSFTLLKLIYDEQRQVEIAQEYFAELKRLIDEGAFHPTFDTLLTKVDDARKEQIERLNLAANLKILQAMFRMFEFKNPAFAEEREWRLVGHASKKLEDSGEKEFRTTRHTIVPFYTVPLENLDLDPVVRVTLGPKHQTPAHVVEHLLRANGLKSVEVVRSKATYR